MFFMFHYHLEVVMKMENMLYSFKGLAARSSERLHSKHRWPKLNMRVCTGKIEFET